MTLRTAAARDRRLEALRDLVAEWAPDTWQDVTVETWCDRFGEYQLQVRFRIGAANRGTCCPLGVLVDEGDLRLIAHHLLDRARSEHEGITA